MKILAIESSTAHGGVALLCESKGILATRKTDEPKTHSERFNGFVTEVLADARLSLQDVDAFAVGQGPGSFTGIRVAANIGKTYSFVFNKPLVTADSLLNLANQMSPQNLPIVSLINAHKNMVYLASFTRNPSGKLAYDLGPAAYSVRELSQVITTPHIVVGDGWDSYQQYLPQSLKQLLVRPSSPFSDYPTAESLAAIGLEKVKNNQTIDWKLFSPLYIRESEAEENKKGIKIQPLT